MKSIAELSYVLADKFELPEDILIGAAKVSVIAGRKVLIENHSGLYEYSDIEIEVDSGHGKISITGDALRITAMNRQEILISGNIKAVEWE